jgi:hypothetical protein
MKDYSRVCKECIHKPFSHCDNEKGRYYKPHSLRETFDSMPEYETCAYFEPRRKQKQNGKRDGC